MSRTQQNAGFVCDNCGAQVVPVDNTGYRNHCPFCLWSKHVDVMPGDRSSTCGGLMRPDRLQYRSGKGFQIVHRCLECGAEKANVIAWNTVQPDDVTEIAGLSGARVGRCGLSRWWRS